MMKDLIYTIPKEKHTKENIKAILKSHSEIKFVSFVGVDLSGNDTDEKIPDKEILNKELPPKKAPEKEPQEGELSHE